MRFRKESNQENSWHIISARFPNIKSAVGSHTLTLSSGLRDCNQNVHVWYESIKTSLSPSVKKGVQLHQVQKMWSQEFFEQLNRYFDSCDEKKIILLQYSPLIISRKQHLILNEWLEMRSKKGNLIGVVVHRDFDYRSSKIKYINVNFWLEKMQNSLLSETFDFCHRIFLKSETYGKQFNKKILSDKCIKLPTPSHVNCVKNKQRSLNLRKAFAHEATTIIGTFGSFKNLAYNKVIKQLVPMLLSDHKERSWLFIGRGSEDFVKNLFKDYPHLENQVDKAGELNIAALSAHVQACDIMVHPYPRGVNTSRSSIMVSLSHGKPVITTTGPLTEPIWKESECVCLVPEKDITSILKYVENLQINSEIRQALSKKSLETYSRNFSLEKCVSTLIKTFSEL